VGLVGLGLIGAAGSGSSSSCSPLRSWDLSCAVSGDQQHRPCPCPAAAGSGSSYTISPWKQVGEWVSE